jgi:hypothetical protein
LRPAFVHAFITDTFDPKTGASGATGKTYDWRVTQRLVELTDRPILLAAGIFDNGVRVDETFIEVQAVKNFVGIKPWWEIAAKDLPVSTSRSRDPNSRCQRARPNLMLRPILN